jgi:protein disulfide isomerase
MVQAITILLLLGVGLTVAGGEADLGVASKHTTILTEDTFSQHVGSSAATFVAFHAPWCGHCKSLAPKFEETALKIHTLFPEVSMATLDADAFKTITQQYAVTGFPSLKLFVPGSKPIDYDSDRSTEAMVAWIGRQMTVKSTELSSVETFDTFLDKNNVAIVVGFPRELANTHDDQDLAEVLSKTFDFPVGHFGDDSIWKHLHARFGTDMNYEADDDVVVFMHRKFDKETPMLRYDNEVEASAIKTFVSINILPPVVVFSNEMSKYIFASPLKKHVILFTSDQSIADGGEVHNAFYNSAVSSRGTILSITVGDDTSGSGIASFFSVRPSDRPCIYAAEILQGSAPIKYQGPSFSGDSPNAGAIKTFFDDFSAGLLKVYVKSQDTATLNQDKSAVMQLNAESVMEIKRSHLSYLVLFYSPGCGHCVAMHPIWDKLHKTFADNTDFVVAKIDVTSNDLPAELAVSAFPTIKLFLPGKPGTVFDGARTAKDIRRYLKANGIVVDKAKEDLNDAAPSVDMSPGNIAPAVDKTPDEIISEPPIVVNQANEDLDEEIIFEPVNKAKEDLDEEIIFEPVNNDKEDLDNVVPPVDMPPGNIDPAADKTPDVVPPVDMPPGNIDPAADKTPETLNVDPSRGDVLEDLLVNDIELDAKQEL